MCMDAILSEPTIIFRIPRLYRPTMSEAELYEATPRSWKLDPKRARKASLALAVEGGIIRAVYIPERWVPTPDPEYAGRWAFEGAVAVGAIDLVGKSVARLFRKGESNPVKYVNL